ncbi:MAG: DUF1476 domain-containing protein [Hyphomicrobiales bacterium]
MTGIDDRGDAFENKFAHDEALQFKAMARRNKLLGVWAAEKLGLSADETADYAKSVVRSDFEEPGEEDVYRKIKGDFDEANVDVSEADIRAAMSDLMVQAQEQIQNEG